MSWPEVELYIQGGKKENIQRPLLNTLYRFFFNFHLRQGGPGEGERATSMWEKDTDQLHVPHLGIEPTTWVSALTGNQTCDLSVTGRCSNQLSHTGQGYTGPLKAYRIKPWRFRIQAPFDFHPHWQPAGGWVDGRPLDHIQAATSSLRNSDGHFTAWSLCQTRSIALDTFQSLPIFPNPQTTLFLSKCLQMLLHKY